MTEALPVLSVVVPVYNEGEAVEPVLRALTAGVITPHEILVVYDFDGDTTVPVVARLARSCPRSGATGTTSAGACSTP